MVSYLFIILSSVILGSPAEAVRPVTACYRVWREAPPLPQFRLSPSAELLHPYLYRVQGFGETSYVFAYLPHLLSKHHVPSSVQQFILSADEVVIDHVVDRQGEWQVVDQEDELPTAVPESLKRRIRVRFAWLEKFKPRLARVLLRRYSTPAETLVEAVEYLPQESLYDILYIAFLARSYPDLDVSNHTRFIEQMMHTLYLEHMLRQLDHKPPVRMTGLSLGLIRSTLDLWEEYTSNALLFSFLDYTKSRSRLDRSWQAYWGGEEPPKNENPFEMLGDAPPEAIDRDFSTQTKKLLVDEIYWHFIDREHPAQKRMYLVSAPTFFGANGLRQALEMGGFKVERMLP